MLRPELETAASRMATVVTGVDDADLDRPTPCRDYSVAALLDHIDGFVGAFVAAGTRTQDDDAGPPPPGDARHLRGDWRDALPARLDALVDAWRPEHAYDGTVRAGTLTMPAAMVAVVAVEELVVLGWDLARAVGAPYDATPAELAVLEQFFAQFGPEQRGDAYAPARAVDASASELDRVVAESGRDPSWSPDR